MIGLIFGMNFLKAFGPAEEPKLMRPKGGGALARRMVP